MTIEFGALADPLSKQLAGTKISKKDLKYIDRVNDAICVLRIGSFITMHETDKARRKLIDYIEGKATAA